VAVGLLFAASECFGAPVYTFNIVAKTNDVIGGKVLTSFYPPSLNSNGTVAFVAIYQGGNKGIFTQSSALAVTGDTVSGQLLTDFGPLSTFNDSGTAAFLAPFSGGSGIFTQSVVVAKTGDTIGGKTITSPQLTPHALNDLGAVAFYGDYSGGKGIFTQTDLLAKTGDTIGGKTLTDIDSYVAMNNAGSVAFEGTYSGGSGIFTNTALLAKTGDVISGQALSTFGINASGPSMNDNGTAVFLGINGITTGVFTQDGLIAKTGDPVSGVTLGTIFFPTINNTGMVAYIGFYTSPSGHGIFTQYGAVVRTGDTVGGKIIQTISPAFGPSLNDHGDIAFLANFTDSTSGIVVATLTNPDTPCSTLNAAGASFGSSGGSTSFAVTAPGGCTFTPSTHVDWITVTTPGPITGSSGVSYTVAPNPTPSSRSGTISLSFGAPFKPNQVFTVTQAGNTCAFVLSSPAPVPSAGISGSVTVTAGPGSCPWTAVSHDVWITLTSGSSGSGTGSVGYTVSANPGPARTGTLTVAGQTVTITQQAQPTVTSLSPVSGSGANHTIVFTFTDPDGYQDLRILNVLINNALNGNNACYLAYDRLTNTLYMVPDNGTGLLPGLVLNGSGSVSNSQCTVNGAGSSALGAGNTLTMTLSMNFNQTTFPGDKITYLAARDNAFNNSGWRVMGVWSVPRLTPVFPSIMSATPSEGTGVNQQFVVTYRDATSSANLRTMQVLLNSDLNANSACYMGYDHASNQLYLVDDTNNSLLLPGIAPNSATGTVENSQCRIDGAGTTKSESGTDLILTVNLTFKPSFVGSKVVFTGVQTISNANSDWHALGYWHVP